MLHEYKQNTSKMSGNIFNQIKATKETIEGNYNSYSNLQTQPIRSILQAESTASNLQGEPIPMACSCSFLDLRNIQPNQNSNINNSNWLSIKNIGNKLKDEKRDFLLLKESEPKQLVNELKSIRFSNRKKRKKLNRNNSKVIVRKTKEEENTYHSKEK
jgi:hypothetical protein